MSDQPPSRFTPQNKTTHDRLSTNTVGLVALSDFRKRRAEALEQHEREAREAALSSTNVSTPDRSLTATPNPVSDISDAERQKKKKKRAKALVSFGEDEDEGEEAPVVNRAGKKKKDKAETAKQPEASDGDAGEASKSSSGDDQKKPSAKVSANSSVAIVPRALTKAALRREAAEREALRKEFLLLQAAVKATEIAIPFVFYDGTSTPGGTVRVKKGDYVWLFLDKSRKVAAQLRVGGDKVANIRREWARVGVDDLMLVRGTIIIPHHYEFYFFIINKTIGPGNQMLFNYSAEAPPKNAAAAGSGSAPTSTQGLSNPSKTGSEGLPDLASLEGFSDDPTFTKVVDRRWYERNKHIYPANVWQDFDPEKDYQKEIRRDPGGNAFFFSKWE